jgi:hypothetical protein
MSAADQLQAMGERIAELEAALLPFVRMHRPGCDPKEVACQRGHSSDITLLVSDDFRNAALAIGWHDSMGDYRYFEEWLFNRRLYKTLDSLGAHRGGERR